MRLVDILIVLLVLLAGARADAAANAEPAVERMRFARISVEQGLSQATVRALVQDPRGFLWVGTQDGLNRWDGHRFEVHGRGAGPRMLRDAHVTALALDARGRLVVGTQTGGVAVLDAEAGGFINYTSDDTAGLAAGAIAAIAPGTGALCWVALLDGTLHQLDLDRRVATRIDLPGRTAPAAIRALHARADGGVLVLAADGVRELDGQGALVRTWRDRDDRDIDATAIAPRGEGWWIATADRGVFGFDATGTEVQRLDLAGGLPDLRVAALALQGSGVLWIGTYDGLARHDPASGRTDQWRHDETRSDSLSANRVQSLLVDRDDVLWVGTWYDGLNLHDPRSTRFGAVRRVAGAPSSLPGNRVTGVHVDPQGRWWFGLLDGQGVVAFDPERGVRAQWSVGLGTLPAGDVQTLASGPDGALWVGALREGLLRLDPATGAVRHWRNDPADAGSLGADSVQRIAFDADGGLWVATIGGGVSHRCAQCTTFRHWHARPGAADDLGGDLANTLWIAPDGQVWVGLRGGGLSIIDPADGRVVRHPAMPDRADGLRHDSVTVIVADGAGRRWLGTQGGGVHEVLGDGPDQLRFRNIGRDDGLASETIGGIVPAADGSLWISTTIGVSHYDPASGRVDNFGTRAGVQSRGYFIGAYASDPEGRILFGGLGGVTVVDPRQATAAVLIRSVEVTDIASVRAAGGDNTVRLDPQSPNRRWLLPPGAASFEIGFSALHYPDPNAVTYAYRVDGIDPDWQVVDASRRYASYGALDAGVHRFRVRARVGDTAWSPETVVEIAVSAPWWESERLRNTTLGLVAVLALVLGWLLRQRLRERERAQARLAESEARLKLALWGTGNELWDIDLASRRMRRENPLQTLGERAHEVPDYLGLRDGIHPDDRGRFVAAMIEHLKARSQFFDATYRARDPDGQWRWFRARARVVERDPDGRARRLVGTNEDIHEAKSHEIELESLARELERRVNERTTDLTVANRNLKHTIDQLKQTQGELVESEKMAALGGLVAGVAHEINTPLGVAVTAASHVEGELGRIEQRLGSNELTRSDLDAFIGVARDGMRFILRNLQRAARLIGSFKQVAVDQSSDDLRPINLRDYLEEVLTSLQPALKKTRHQVTVECADDLMLVTYPGAIYQIVVNLVMNSLTHAWDEGAVGQIRIAAKSVGTDIVLTYVDDGRGMTEETRRRAFEPFYTTRRGQGGSGLGLHIVWNLATGRLHGAINCDSAPGLGVRFELRFPVEQPPV
jgi:ligand-binding sensor domain-containing protein/signal transduction histidine kinase